MVICWFGSLIFRQKNPVIFMGFFRVNTGGAHSCGSMVEWNLPEVIVNCYITLCLLLLTKIYTTYVPHMINFPTASPPVNRHWHVGFQITLCSRRMLAAKIIFHCIEELIAIGSAEV